MSFKAVKKWDGAAKAYKRAAECFVKSKSESEAAVAFTECARAYVKAGDGKSEPAHAWRRQRWPQVSRSLARARSIGARA